MGYAIFAARKIMLTNRINNLNFRIMCLSQKQQTLSDISGKMQSYFGQMQMMLGVQNSGFNNPMNQMMLMQQAGNMFSGGNGNNNAMGSIFQSFQAQQQQQSMYQMMLSMQAEGMMAPVAAEENQIEQERKRLETQVKAATAELEQVEKAEDDQIKKSAPKYA